jgi:hypothetical protein
LPPSKTDSVGGKIYPGVSILHQTLNNNNNPNKMNNIASSSPHRITTVGGATGGEPNFTVSNHENFLEPTFSELMRRYAIIIIIYLDIIIIF